MAFTLEVLTRNDRDRCRAFDLRALDARTGDRDAIQFGGVLAGLGWCRGGLFFFLLVGCVLRERRAGHGQGQHGKQCDAETVRLDAEWRSEERRVGKECVNTCRSRSSAYPSTKNKEHN